MAGIVQNSSKIGSRSRKTVSAENREGQHENSKRHADSQNPANPFVAAAKRSGQMVFHCLCQAVQAAPYQEGPVGAMPQAADQKCNHQIGIPAGNAPAVAPQGNVHIIPEPAGKAHMPAGPQLFHTGRQKGLAEIFGQAKPQHLPHAQNNVGISRKIGIELEGVQDGGKDQLAPVKRSRICKSGIDDHSRTIRNRQLFEIAPGTTLGTVHGTLEIIARRRAVQLGHQVIIAIERPLGHGKKEGGITKQPGKFAFSRNLSAAHIQKIPGELKAVIGQPKGLVQVPQPRHQHSAVLEHQKRRKSRHKAQSQPEPAVGPSRCCAGGRIPDHQRSGQHRKERPNIHGEAEHRVGTQHDPPAVRRGGMVPHAQQHRHKHQKGQGIQ